MTSSNSLIPKLHARAGAPTSGLISTMSTTTTSLAAVKTTARVVSSSTKPVQATSAKVSSSSVVSTKVTSSSLVRAVTSSTPPAKVTSTTAVPVVKTTSTTLSTPKVVPTTSSTTSLSPIPTTTSTSSRISTSTSSSTTSSKSTQSSSSTLSTSSSSSSINIVAPASATASSVQGKETSSSGLSGGAIAGIIIGILVLAIAGALLAFRLIQKRRRANRRMTGNLQAWTDRTSYFSASGTGAGAGMGEREVEAGQVPFREMGDKDQDGGPWALGEKQVYEEPVLAGVGAGSAAYGGHYNQQAYQPEYQQQMQQHAYQPYADQAYVAQPYGQPPHTPTHQTQPQGYPYTPTAGTATPNTFGGPLSPVNAVSPVPSQEPVAGPVLQDGMSVVVRQGFVRTLEDELVIAPGDHLTVVQAYDDGWCLCQSALNEQGVVPQSCLEPVSAYAQGRTSPIQMPVPAVVVSEGNDEVLANEPEKKLPSLPRSETTKSLAVSERSERRSSLFLNAAAAGLYLQQNVTPTNQAFT